VLAGLANGSLFRPALPSEGRGVFTMRERLDFLPDSQAKSERG
jgi:hypothetical protein